MLRCVFIVYRRNTARFLGVVNGDYVLLTLHYITLQEFLRLIRKLRVIRVVVQLLWW